VAEPRTAALLDGKPVVGFEVVRSRGASEIEVAEGVRAALAKLKAEHPDISITEAFNFVDPVQENYDGSMKLLYEGALLAVLVVWLFLRDWRATFVSAVALPLSAIPTFFVHVADGLLAQRRDAAGCRWWSASWSTTPSSRSRTSCATCAWARRPTRRPWRRPTRSAWR
jgi:multidrug efflux pump subunit AcrB